MGESKKQAGGVCFNRKLRLDFRGSRFTSDDEGCGSERPVSKNPGVDRRSACRTKPGISRAGRNKARRAGEVCPKTDFREKSERNYRFTGVILVASSLKYQNICVTNVGKIIPRLGVIWAMSYKRNMGIRRILQKYANPNDQSYFSHGMRRKRFAAFLAFIDIPDRPIKILDVGGTQNFWENMFEDDIP